jgi:hypothetical protein
VTDGAALARRPASRNSQFASSARKDGVKALAPKRAAGDAVGDDTHHRAMGFTDMADLVYIAVALAFVAVCVAYVRGLDRIVRAAEEVEKIHEETAP